MRTSLILLIGTMLAVGLLAPAGAAATTQANDGCEYPIELTDGGSGETVTVEEAPDEVVALQPSDAQTAFEIGAGDAVVGMPQTDATAQLGAEDRTDVAEGPMSVDVEAVVDLDPDVVLAANTTDGETVDQLRELGYTVYYFSDASSIDDVVANVETTGQLTGACDGADETAEWMTQRLDLIESAVDEDERPLGYLEMGDGYTAGTGTFQHELLVTAGIENLAAVEGVQGWGALDEEQLLSQDPSWIVYDDSWDEPPVPDSAQATTAYQEDNFVVVDANSFNQPAPGIVFAAEQLLEGVHPDAHESISGDLEDLDDEYGMTPVNDGDGDGEGDDADDADDESATSIAGFGFLPAVAALFALVAVARLRR